MDTSRSHSHQIIQHSPSKQKYRFFNLALYIIAALVNDSPINCLASIGPHTAQLYQVSQSIVVVCGLINMLLFPFLFIPIQYLLDQHGLKFATLIGQMFAVLGAIIRLGIHFNFTFYFIGTFFSAFGCLMFASSINKFVATWFPYQQIPLVNSLMWMCALNSGPLSTILTGVILGQQSTKHDYQNFLTYHSALIILLQIILMIFLKGKPEIPFNHFALAKRQSYRAACSVLKKRKSFILVVIANCFFFGFMLAILTTLSWLLKVYGMGSDKTVIFLGLNNLCGSLGTLLFGYLLKKNKNYKKTIFMCVCITTVSLSLIFICLQLNLMVVAMGFTAITGFFGFPVITLSFDFVAELGYPVTQNVTTGYLNLFEDTFAFILAFFLSFLFDGQNLATTRIGMILIIALAITGSVIFSYSKNELFRTKYEQQKIKEQQQSVDDGDDNRNTTRNPKIKQSLLSQEQ